MPVIASRIFSKIEQGIIGRRSGGFVSNITVTTLGSANSTSTAPVVITVSADVPVGALIVVCAADFNPLGAGGESVADSVNGAYTAGPVANNNNLILNGFGAMFWFWNSAALTSGVSTITYTPGGSAATGNFRAATAFYATGIQTSANPGEASASATGTGTTPSVTSGSPTAAGELFVGCVATSGGASAFTQDSTNAAYATPPDRRASAGSVAIIAGGSVVNAAGTALKFEPTLGTARPWAALIAAFKKS